MSDCENRIEAISALVDGELPESDRTELERHLSSCGECRAVYGDFLAISAAMRKAEESAPHELADAIKIRSGPIMSIPRWKRLVGIAAAVAACVVFTLVLTRTGKFADLIPQSEKQNMADFSIMRDEFGEHIEDNSAFDSAEKSAASLAPTPTPAPYPTALPSAASAASPDSTLGGHDELPRPPENAAGISPSGSGGAVYGTYSEAAEDEAFAIFLSGDTKAAAEYFSKLYTPLGETAAGKVFNITVDQLADAIGEIPITITNDPDFYSVESSVGTVVIAP